MTELSPRTALETTVATAADLYDVWVGLMGEGGFARRTLWLIFVESGGYVTPHIMPIDDVPERPDPGQLTGLSAIVGGLVGGEVADSVAMLLSRPGPVQMTEADRDWGRALAPLSSWPIHLATADRIQVFAPDDLMSREG